MICYWSFSFGVGTLEQRRSMSEKKPRGGKSLEMMECDLKIEESSEWRMTSKELNVVKALVWTLRVVHFSGKVIGCLDTCHHPDEGQILTITAVILS